MMAVAAIAAMVLVPSAMVMADNGQNEETDEENNGHHGTPWIDDGGYHHDGTPDSDQEDENETAERGESNGLMGKVTYSNGRVDGSFVSFTYDDETGVMGAFTLTTGTGPVEVFTSISISGLVAGNITSHGSLLVITCTDLQVVVHDNPTGMIHVITNSSIPEITYYLSSGFDVTAVQNELNDRSLNNKALISNGNISGVVASGNGTLSYGNDIGGWIKIKNETEQSMVRFSPVFKVGDSEHDAQIFDAINDNRLGAEMSLVCGERGVSFDATEYHPDMTMTLVQGKKGFVQLEISSTVHQGRAVLINLDQQSMTGNVHVLIDGQVVRLANNSAEVLYANGQRTSDACYFLTEEGNTSSVTLYVPAFSTHSIVIESSLPTPDITTPVGAAVVASAAALTIVAAVLLFRKK
ncbi:MAG: hypothetical protein WCK39_02625 [Methanomassiliicoccales archaeon]